MSIRKARAYIDVAAFEARTDDTDAKSVPESWL